MSSRDHSQPTDLPAADAAALARAGAVHDVNQMLAVIAGRADLLVRQLEKADGGAVDPLPDLERHLRTILLAAGDAAAMLRRLAPAGAEAAVVAATADLRGTLEQARGLVWPADSTRYPWRNGVESGVRVAVPPQMLREVLSNLLLNASEAMPAGGGLQVNLLAAADGRVRVRVADSGPGLPAGDPERLFVPGVSGSGDSARGIGLAGCRQLLAEAGGKLTAEAPDPERPGAVFLLDLPAAPAENWRPLPVLVVDDETGVREMLRDVLESWGCPVQTFRDGAEMLAALQPGAAAAAIVDLNLPGLGGLELAKRLRVGDPCLSIVLISGWQQQTAPDAAQDPAVDLTADKPLDLDRMREILQQAFDLHEGRRRT